MRYKPTNQLTKAILEKRTFSRVVMKFVTLYEIRLYFAVFTMACDHIQQMSSRYYQASWDVTLCRWAPNSRRFEGSSFLYIQCQTGKE